AATLKSAAKFYICRNSLGRSNYVTMIHTMKKLLIPWFSLLIAVLLSSCASEPASTTTTTTTHETTVQPATTTQTTTTRYCLEAFFPRREKGTRPRALTSFEVFPAFRESELGPF